MTYPEAPQPQRGQTLDEQQEQLRAQQPPPDEGGSDFRNYLKALHPRVLLALGDGMPVVIKQLVQLLFLLCWPFWAVAGLVVGVIYYGIIYPALWLLFWPVRVWFKSKESDAAPVDTTSRT